MRNTGLEEARAGIKIAGRNINNLRYAGDTFKAESEEELKSLLMKVKSKSKVAQSCPTPSDSMDCISEVIDISPSNLDSSLCFLQPSDSHDIL